MSGLSEAQLTYLKDVLGLESLVLGNRPPTAMVVPPPAPAAVSEYRIRGKLETARLLVLASGESKYPLAGEAGDLADKMIQAMKLGTDAVAIVEWTSTIPDDVREIWSAWSGFSLSFGERAASELAGRAVASGSWVEVGNRKMMVTDAPSRLITEPARKKMAWAHLQSVMKLL